ELMRHVVRQQTTLATGSVREPIPTARWLLAPGPTFLLFRRMVLWRQHSYPAALAMERRRLEAVAIARQWHGRAWRRKVGPLIRLQIGLAELDATSTAAALTIAEHRPLNGQPHGQHPAIGAANQRPETGQQTATTPANPRPSTRPTRGQDTAARVAKTVA